MCMDMSMPALLGYFTSKNMSIWVAIFHSMFYDVLQTLHLAAL